mmetsp:Transcript_70108/g.222236  ORF Transcript_70108/g.222236 Transcript_70108/m.222236 type:complete len:297 (-) Transcript_70108:348-1238(-)
MPSMSPSSGCGDGGGSCHTPRPTPRTAHPGRRTCVRAAEEGKGVWDHLLHELGLPGEVLDGGLGVDGRARALVDHVELGVQDHQAGDPLHAEDLREGHLALLLRERHRQPRHLPKVLVELLLLAVRGDKHHLEVLARFLHCFVCADELRRELSAGRAPVRREVQADMASALLDTREGGLPALLVGKRGAKDCAERGLRPGELFGLHDLLSPLRGDHRPVRSEEHEGGDPPHLRARGSAQHATARTQHSNPRRQHRSPLNDWGAKPPSPCGVRTHSPSARIAARRARWPCAASGIPP